MQHPSKVSSIFRRFARAGKTSVLRRVVMGGMSCALALAGLVVFATEAAAWNNYVTPTASCSAPNGAGATISWLITNDWPENETGTASTTGDGSLSSGTFGIASSPNYPTDVSTTTLTSTFTAAQLASQLSSNPTITFNWSATWTPGNVTTSGSATYDLGELPNGCKGSPTIATWATPTSETLGGGSLNDTATLSSGKSPTGTITFYLFNPSETCSTSPGSGSYTFAQAVTVSGDGNYDTTGGPSPTSAGTWHWLAVYSGDADNSGANSGCTSEPVTVTMAAPSLTTWANPTTEAVGGGALADSATLGGGSSPTGTITFYLFSPSQTCSTWPASGSYAFSQTVSVSGNGTYGPTTGGPNPSAMGTWHWLAVYSGDTNNSGANSGCTSEPVTVTKASPSVTTAAKPTNETVGGGGLNDTATLAGGYNPTGTITFYLFSPSQTCTAWPANSGDYSFTQTLSVSDGDGTYDTSGGPSPTVAGTWNWVAVYSGDANNNGTNSGCATEPVTVGTAAPSVTTTANPTSETVGGPKLNDSATLSGGQDPGGSVTFYLFSPSQTCSAWPANSSDYSFTQTVSVSGDGTYGTTGGFTPTSAGTWEWLAVYSGDANNGTSNSSCGSEPVVICKSSPSVTTAANPTNETLGGAKLNDTATLAGGYNPTGTITFYLFAPGVSYSATSPSGYAFSQSVPVSGDGTYDTSGGFSPTSAGTWEWLAVYSGDANNNGAHSGCGSEPVTVTKAAPSVTTAANPTGETVGGAGLNDTATVAGGTNPTGTVTFYLFSPSQTCSAWPANSSDYTFTQTVSVSGDGTYDTTDGPSPTAAGTWNWVAVYSGDTNNSGTDSVCGTEPVTVSNASPIVTTKASPTNETVGGADLNDSGTISGGDNPTGTVTFYLFSPTQNCSVTPQSGSYTFHQTITVSGDGTYDTTGGPSPMSAGTWQWLAVYSGDTNNAGTTSGCGSEPVQVCQASPSVTTAAMPTSENVGAGDLNDTATLAGGYNPTGTITFYLFSPNQICTAWPILSSVYTFTETVSVSGDGTYATSDGPNPSVAGTWNWVAVYSGDANNNSTNSGCGNEPVTVGKTAPTVTTSANPTSEIVGGADLADAATLSGGYNPTGTITFYLFSPSQTCTAVPANSSDYTFTDTVSVTGNGTYDTIAGPSPTAAGTWNWVAVYSGDANNGTTNSGCGTEPVTVNQASPTVTTAANPTSETVGGANLNDTGTIGDGYNPTGTVTFYLFAPGVTCSATSPSGYAFSQAVTVTGDGTYDTTGGFSPTSAGTWNWLAVYSGDANNNGANSGCTTEPVTVNQASPTVTTAANPTSETVGGANLNDAGTIAGGYNPTGTVTFYLFAPGVTCSATSPGGYAFSQAVTVTGDGTYDTTGGFSPTSAGTWNWLAVYSGDANNNGANSGCASEPVTVNQASPTVTTTANPTSETVGGANLNDTGTLSGGYNATGTITFYLFAPGVTCSATSPSGYAFSQAVTVDGDGTYDTTGGFSPTSAGTWNWLAVYSGDANNNGANSGCTTEPVTVNQASPTVTTAANPTSETVGGANLNDAGTIAGGYNPTGTVTFYLFAPGVTCSATSPGGYAFSQAVTVTGDGTYDTTGGFSPTSAGTWNWLAVYSGDANNNGANSGCASEPVTVNQASPTVTTAANPTSETVGGANLNDTGTLSGGYNATGTVAFYLFAPGVTCSATSPSGYAFSQAVTVDGDGTYDTTGGFSPNAAGTWNWLAVYSGDTNNTAANSGCDSEPVTVGQAAPTVTTAANPTTENVNAGPLNDTGTIAGGYNPTGTVTFYLFAPGVTCSATSPSGYAFSQAISVDGDGTYDTTGGPIPTTTGTWNWLAVYSGDTNNTGANSGCATEPVVITTPNFSVLKTNVPGNGNPVVPGSTIPYTVTIENVGNGTGSATITDDVPSNLTVQGTPLCAVTGLDSCTVANPSGSTWTFTVTLAPGDTATVTFSATLSATDTADVVNTATITTGTCTSYQSGDTTVPAQCTSTVTNPVPNFTVTKTNVPATGTSVPPDSTIDYTVAIKNVGDGAGSATITDAVPSNLTVQGTPACAVTAPDTCTVTNTTGSTWTFIVSLAAGHSATVTFATRVAATATGTITNTATITTGPCNTSSGCSSTVSNPVTPVVTTPVSVTPTTTTTTTPPPTTPVTTPLAFTGARLEQEWLFGLGAAILGAAFILIARLRRRPRHVVAEK